MADFGAGVCRRAGRGAGVGYGCEFGMAGIRQKALEGEPDDPFVDLLRERLASGSEVERVNLVEKPNGEPADAAAVLLIGGFSPLIVIGAVFLPTVPTAVIVDRE